MTNLLSKLITIILILPIDLFAICNAPTEICLTYYKVRKHKQMGFRIKSDKKESENKTIRFPVELINEIEEAIVGKDVSFSGFVIQACRYALKDLENDDKKKKKKQ